MWGSLGCSSHLDNKTTATTTTTTTTTTTVAPTAAAAAAAPAAAAAAARVTLWRGTFLGPPPTGHVLRFIDSGVFVYRWGVLPGVSSKYVGLLGLPFPPSSCGRSWSRRACVFLLFFKRFRRDVRDFCCGFWTPFRHEIRWCFESSFSIGFRSYVRDFLGAIFMLFRPSVPWCFPVREPLENNPFSHRRTNKLDTCSIVDFDAWLQSGRQRARGRIACIGMAYLLRASAWCIPCTRDTYPVSIELW